jgi:hypothetical protein
LKSIGLGSPKASKLYKKISKSYFLKVSEVEFKDWFTLFDM